MKAVERNIFRHPNGTLYFIARRGGILVTRSLGTRILREARKKIRDRGVEGLMKQEPKPAKFGAEKPRIPELLESLEEFEKGLVLLSGGAKEMASRGKAIVLKFCSSWKSFSSVEIWNAYRLSGLDSGRKKEFTSGANHLRWYFRKLIPWAIDLQILDSSSLKELDRLPKIKIPPRRIRVPDPGQVDE